MSRDDKIMWRIVVGLITVYVIAFAVALLWPRSAEAAEEPVVVEIKYHAGEYYSRVKFLGNVYCFARTYDELIDFPRDWRNLFELIEERQRDLTPEELAVCTNRINWVVAENIYRGEPRETRPASIINGGEGRARVGSECFEFVADSTRGRQYRRVYTVDGYQAVAICEPVINVTNSPDKR